MSITLSGGEKLKLQSAGFVIVEVPAATIPKAWFKHKDGRIVELPADMRSLRYYQNKGLVLVNKPLSVENTEKKI